MSDVSFGTAYRAAHGPRISLPYRSTYQSQYDLINQYHKLKQLTDAERERMKTEHLSNNSQPSMHHHLHDDEQESKYDDHHDHHHDHYNPHHHHELTADTSFVSDSATGESVLDHVHPSNDIASFTTASSRPRKSSAISNQFIDHTPSRPLNNYSYEQSHQPTHLVDNTSYNYNDRKPIVPKLPLPSTHLPHPQVQADAESYKRRPNHEIDHYETQHQDEFTPAHSYRQGYQSDDQSYDDQSTFIDSGNNTPTTFRSDASSTLHSPIHSYRQPIESHRQPVEQHRQPIEQYRQAIVQTIHSIPSTEQTSINPQSVHMTHSHPPRTPASINQSIDQTPSTIQSNRVPLVTPNKADMRPAGITRLNFDGVGAALYHNEKPNNQILSNQILSNNQTFTSDPSSANRSVEWRPSKAMLNQHQQLTDPITFRYDALASEPVSRWASRSASGVSTPIHYSDVESSSQSLVSTPRSNTWMNHEAPTSHSHVPPFSRQAQAKLRLLKQRIDPSTVTSPAGMPSHRAERSKIPAASTIESSSVPRSCARPAAHGVLPTPPDEAENEHHGKAHVPSYDQYVATQANAEIRTSRRGAGTLSHAQVDHTTEILNFDKAVANDRRYAAAAPLISTRPLDSLFDIDYGFNKLTVGEIEREKYSERLHYEKELARIRAERVVLNAQLRQKRR